MRPLATALAILVAVVLVAASKGRPGSSFEAALSGAQEVPPVTTDLSGTIKLRFDDALGSIHFDLRLSEPENQVLAAHLHCGPAGTNGPIVVDLLDQFGPFEVLGGGRRALSGTITAAEVTPIAAGTGTCPLDVNNVASLLHALREGVLYANAHSNVFLGGETRGQIFTRR